MKQAKTVTVKQKYVEDRIHDAARTLRRLPEERVQGYFSTWPKIKRDEMEILQMEKEPMRIRPSMDDITEMEEVLFVWLRWLEVDERKLVWQRAAVRPAARVANLARQRAAHRRDGQGAPNHAHLAAAAAVFITTKSFGYA